jgi:hypothetical protein
LKNVLFYLSISKTISIPGCHFPESARQVLKDMEGFYVWWGKQGPVTFAVLLEGLPELHIPNVLYKEGTTSEHLLQELDKLTLKSTQFKT